MTSPAPAYFVCPACDARSANPDDLANGYCGRCHRFTADRPGEHTRPHDVALILDAKQLGRRLDAVYQQLRADGHAYAYSSALTARDAVSDLVTQLLHDNGALPETEHWLAHADAVQPRVVDGTWRR